MKTLNLNDNLIFAIESSENNKVRLVVVKADHELACRKETVKN